MLSENAPVVANRRVIHLLPLQSNKLEYGRKLVKKHTCNNILCGRDIVDETQARTVLFV